MDIYQDYEAKINNTHAWFFHVMDQTSLSWCKKIKAMEKVFFEGNRRGLKPPTRLLLKKGKCFCTKRSWNIKGYKENKKGYTKWTSHESIKGLKSSLALSLTYANSCLKMILQEAKECWICLKIRSFWAD
jgi:hypothetical protein